MPVRAVIPHAKLIAGSKLLLMAIETPVPIGFVQASRFLLKVSGGQRVYSCQPYRSHTAEVSFLRFSTGGNLPAVCCEEIELSHDQLTFLRLGEALRFQARLSVSLPIRSVIGNRRSVLKESLTWC